jgi:hypothetical protein
MHETGVKHTPHTLRLFVFLRLLGNIQPTLWLFMFYTIYICCKFKFYGSLQPSNITFYVFMCSLFVGSISALVNIFKSQGHFVFLTIIFWLIGFWKFSCFSFQPHCPHSLNPIAVNFCSKSIYKYCVFYVSSLPVVVGQCCTLLCWQFIHIFALSWAAHSGHVDANKNWVAHGLFVLVPAASGHNLAPIELQQKKTLYTRMCGFSLVVCLFGHAQTLVIVAIITFI